jgi:hypothetical protein
MAFIKTKAEMTNVWLGCGKIGLRVGNKQFGSLHIE